MKGQKRYEIKNRTKISRIDLAGYAKKQLFCSVKLCNIIKRK